jgi:ABC-type sugar transport system substrate-binding protein
LNRFITAVFDAGNDTRNQFRQIEDVLRAPDSDGFDVLLVNPVQESVLQPLAIDAARRGIGWVTLNRFTDYVADLRRRYPTVPLFCVNPDQNQIGHIQGTQFLTLLRKGGSLLYICGPLLTSSASLRLAGVEIVIAGSPVRMAVAAADWSEEGGLRATAGWLNERSRKWRRCVVGAQNDAMALGAREALLQEAQKRDRRELARVPVTGCDGLPSGGQRAVAEGSLTATVVVPTTAGRAVDLLRPALTAGAVPPADVVLAVTSFPDLDTLARTARLPSSTPPRRAKPGPS